MKLATALSNRANLQAKINELQTRLNNNAKTQDGEAPAEKPVELLKELDQNMLELEELMTRINLTNSNTKAEGKTLTELLAHRDCLKQKLVILRDFLGHASQKVDRYSRTEIKIVSTVNVAKMQKQVDDVSKELRLLDEKIQELNWTTELM